MTQHFHSRNILHYNKSDTSISVLLIYIKFDHIGVELLYTDTKTKPLTILCLVVHVVVIVFVNKH